jgi:hypothetical protein
MKSAHIGLSKLLIAPNFWRSNLCVTHRDEQWAAIRIVSLHQPMTDLHVVPRSLHVGQNVIRRRGPTGGSGQIHHLVGRNQWY